MLAGKCLILFSILWPVPFGFIMYPWFGYKIDMPMWGVERGYWWPLLIFLAIGILLCLISNYRSNTASQMHSARFKNTILGAAFKVIGYGGLAIIAFFIVSLLVVALYYLFLTPLIEYSVPIFAGIGIVGFLAYIGYLYYQNKKNENK